MSDAQSRLEEERTKRREEDWMLARMAAEFGFRSHEKGRNWEMTLSTLAEIWDGAKFEKRAPYQGEPGLEAHEEEQP